MSRAQMNTNKRRGTAQMHSTPSFTYVADEGWHRATERYSEFLRRHEGQRILFLELGVGYNTPVIIKYPFWRMTAKNPNAFYACINQNQAVCPPEVQRQSVCIHADIGAVTRRRRTDHFYDRSAGTFEERRPRSKGAAPSGIADLMQNLPRISKQFQPMQRIPTKKPTVQKSCIDRADPDFSGLHNKKERQILRFDVQNLVHLQGLEPWAH